MTNLLDTGQNVGLALAIAVRANTQVDLAGVLVSLERLGNAYDSNVRTGETVLMLNDLE